MSLRSSFRFALLPLATSFLAACSGTDGTSASSSGHVWTCSAVPLDGAPGLTCTAQTGTSDGTSGSSTAGGDGTGAGTGTGTSDGTSDGTSGSPTPTTGGTSDGSNGGSGSYGCTAGAPNCPPVGAKPGTNDGSNSGGASGGGASGGGASNGGASNGGTDDGAGGSPTTYQCSYDASGLVTCTGSTGGGNGNGNGGNGGNGSNGGSTTGTTGTGTIGGSTRGCTLTQGYWKTHPSAWPVTSLTIGGVVYTETQLLALMNTAPAGDASLILADQLIAALLNGATGTVMTDAQAWMAANKGSSSRLPYGVPSGSPAGAQAVALASQIDAYNNGLAGVPHCN